MNVNWRRHLATALVIPSRKDRRCDASPQILRMVFTRNPLHSLSPAAGRSGTRWGLEHTAAQLVSSVRMAVGDLAAMNGHDALGGRRDNSPTCWNPANGSSELPAWVDVGVPDKTGPETVGPVPFMFHRRRVVREETWSSRSVLSVWTGLACGPGSTQGLMQRWEVNPGMCCDCFLGTMLWELPQRLYRQVI